jgi:CelD/BcsL family acetyltransferase involved in cellulose biosynthesis
MKPQIQPAPPFDVSGPAVPFARPIAGDVRGAHNVSVATEARGPEHCRDEKAAIYQWYLPTDAVQICSGFEGCDIYACADLSTISPIWDAFQKRAYCTPYQSRAWIEEWFGKSDKLSITHPWIILVFEGGVLRLLAPLAVENRPLANRLVWMAQDINDYNAPIVDQAWLADLPAERAAKIWQQITHSASGADYIHLTRQPAMLGAHFNPFQGDSAASFSSSAHFLNLHRNWNELYPSIRSSKSRRRLREKLNRLRKSGDLRIRQLRDTDQKAAGISQAMAWKTAQLDRTGGRNPFGNGQTENILVGLAGTPAARDLIRVFALEVNGEQLAITVALAHGDVFNVYITAYDEDKFSKCSPGTIMLVKLIELAARSGYQKFDLSIGDEPYKYDWCDGLLDMSYQSEAINILGKPFVWYSKLSINLKRFIKERAEIFSVLQRLNAKRISWQRKIFPKPVTAADGGG